jgi:MFS family permease
VTTFIGPRAAQSFLETSGWPWGYGTFAIITPVITLPILIVLYLNQRKAFKEGLLVKEKSGRALLQSVNFYFWEFDGKSSSLRDCHLLLTGQSLVVGLLLVCAGFVLFLLPFSLETVSHCAHLFLLSHPLRHSLLSKHAQRQMSFFIPYCSENSLI